jgi:hypothetical protein
MDLKPEIFTFLFYVSKPRDRKLEMLDIIRSFVNNVPEFRDSKITIGSRQITVSSNDFFFAFSATGKEFNMGFACSAEKIDFLNNTLNNVAETLSSKMISTEDKQINFFSAGDFPIKHPINPFEKILEYPRTQHLITDWKIEPRKVEFDCINKNVKNESLGIVLSRKNNAHLLQLYFYQDKRKDFSRDAAKMAAGQMNKFAERILQELV